MAAPPLNDFLNARSIFMLQRIQSTNGLISLIIHDSHEYQTCGLESYR